MARLASWRRGGAVCRRRDDAVKIWGDGVEEREMRVAKEAIRRALVRGRRRVSLTEEW